MYINADEEILYHKYPSVYESMIVKKKEIERNE